jgi:DNA-binding NarL/FixJ family response regulator
MAIKVVIAFSNLIFAKGVARLLEDDPDIEVVDMLRAGSDCREKVGELMPDIVLVDFLTLFNGFEDTRATPPSRFILFDTACGKKNIKAAVLVKGISGVLSINAAPSYLNKAIKEVAKGKLFLDKQTTQDVLTSQREPRKQKGASALLPPPKTSRSSGA